MPWTGAALFQAILAASPYHPVLADCIELTLRRFTENARRVALIEFPNEHFGFFSGTRMVYFALQRFLGTTAPIAANCIYRHRGQSIQMLDEHRATGDDDWRNCVVTFNGRRCFKSRDMQIVDFMNRT